MADQGKPLTFGALLEARRIGAAQVTLVALLLLVLVIDGIDIQLLSLVAPVILEDWSVGRAEFGPAMAGALIGMSAGSLVGGALGDRFGRRTLLVISVFGFGLATVLAGMTSDIPAMTALRIVSGFGFGAAAPNAVALASDWLPERARAKVTSLLSIGTPAGGMIGASVVLAVLPMWGWRGTFYACGLLTVVVALAMLVLVHEAPSYLAARDQEAKARRNVARAWPDGEASDVVFADQAKGNGGKGGNFLARKFLRLNIGAGLAFFMISLVSYALVAWTAIMLTSLGYSMPQALAAVFAFNLAAVGAAILTGFLIGSFGSRITLAGGAFMLLVVLLALLWTLDAHGGQQRQDLAWLVQLLVGLAGGFAGVAMASIYSMMAAGFDVQCRSGGLGFGMTLGRAGGIVASLSGGALLDLGEGAVLPFVGTLALAAAVGVASAFISDRHIQPIPAAEGGAA